MQVLIEAAWTAKPEKRPPKTAAQTAAHAVSLDVEVALTRFLVALTKVA
jgi:hypothetical protein